jgi:hypothetical protein
VSTTEAEIIADLDAKATEVIGAAYTAQRDTFMAKLWAVIAKGIFQFESGGGTWNHRGAWNPLTEYVINDVVENDGSSYVAVADNVGSEPPSADWETVAERGTDGGTGAEGPAGPSNLITESGGPTDLTVGAIADGAVLKRSGSTVVGAATGATGLALLDDATEAEARATIGLTHVTLGVARFDMVPGAVGQNYAPLGYLAQGSFSRASTALVTRGRRLYATHAPAAATDASQIGGYNTTANNLIHFASSTQKWTAYLFFGTKTGTSLRGAFAVSNANPADTNGVANNSIGVRYRPAAGDAAWTAFCTSSGGVTSTGSTGVSVTADTLYVVEVKWDGSSAYVRMATVDETTGAWGSWSGAVTLSSNLPSSSSGLTPATNWWVVGSPGTTPQMDIGGHTVLPWAA